MALMASHGAFDRMTDSANTGTPVGERHCNVYLARDNARVENVLLCN